MKLCGYYCIITSEKMTAKEALMQYEGRDASEKLFQADKSFLDSESMYVQTNERVESKLFLEFIALIVRNRIYNLLRERMQSMEKKSNFLTVPAALDNLDMIQITKVNNGRYVQRAALTKKQRIILSSFGIDKQDIQNIIDEINKTLAGSDTPTSVIEDDDLEEGADTEFMEEE